jgi:predicted naringenin-chalcone synthase
VPAVQRCLAEAGLGPDAVDDLVVVSCTGIDTPGLDLRLAGGLGMRPDLRRTCVLGMGCYGALPGLLRAQQAVLTPPHTGARPVRRAVLVAVELCSLHFQTQDPSIQNAVATALFADGAAAVLLESTAVDSEPRSTNGSKAALPYLVDSASYCDYTTFDHMAFHLTDHGFQMRLSAYVPQLLAAEVEGFIDGLLVRNGLARRDVRFWAVHPGSGKILDHVQARLGLSDQQLCFSRTVLRAFGNMSSPTVLFVLDEMQRSGQPHAGDYGILMAFGPGLTMESALLQW